MITAHLPAGYVLGRLAPAAPAMLPAALVGSILPDLDMVWFYLVDSRRHHHLLWPHLPYVWALVAAATLPIVWRSRWRLPAIGLFAAIFLHLILDTIAGGIAWGAPFDLTLIHMVTVPAAYSHWVISFLLHWTMLLELAIWTAAGWLWVRR